MKSLKFTYVMIVLHFSFTVNMSLKLEVISISIRLHLLGKSYLGFFLLLFLLVSVCLPEVQGFLDILIFFYFFHATS